MKIQIDQTLCKGCGKCMQACSSGAITLVDQYATIEESLCIQCEACVDACPNGAIRIIAEPSVSLPILAQPVPELRVNSTPARSPQSEAATSGRSLAPLAGAALSFLGREVAPRLVDGLITVLERRLSTPAVKPVHAVSVETRISARPGKGIRRQIRNRGSRRNNRYFTERR
jgi:NAD-dependent dihydropyrimidine dehydrogenase PreA subunit